jgi:hypothetical protein
MAININPNRINIASGSAGKSAARERPETENLSAPVAVPRRANENFIPSPESLRTLIASGIEALRRGVRWDRGTILNVLA